MPVRLLRPADVDPLHRLRITAVRKAGGAPVVTPFVERDPPKLPSIQPSPAVVSPFGIARALVPHLAGRRRNRSAAR